MAASITRHKGDLLASVQEGIIVHGCNCEGAMGAGFALALRNRYPAAYAAYKQHEAACGLILGDVNFIAGHQAVHPDRALALVHQVGLELPSRLLIANAMTQATTGRDPSVRYVSYAAVFSAFARVALVARMAKAEVHFPLIGCGLANGKWEEIEPLIETALDGVPAHLWVL